jgi:hypothetical protein
MVDISGVPNLGIPAMGGGAIFGGVPNVSPAWSADQINKSMWGSYSPQQAQAPLSNIFANFGKQTDYYSGLGAAYGRATGGFGGYSAPNADPFAGGAAPFQGYGDAGGIDWSKGFGAGMPQQPAFQMPDYGGLGFGSGWGGFDNSQYLSGLNQPQYQMPDYSSLWNGGGASAFQGFGGAGGGLPSYNAFDPSAWQSAFKMPDYGGLGFGSGQGFGGFDNSQYLSGLQGWGTDQMLQSGRDSLASLMMMQGQGFGAGASPFQGFGGAGGFDWGKASGFGAGASPFQMPDYGGLGFGQGWGGFDNSSFLSGLGQYQQPQAQGGGSPWPSYAGDPSVNFGGMPNSSLWGRLTGFPSLMGEAASPSSPFGAFSFGGAKDQSQFPQAPGMLGLGDFGGWNQGGLLDPSSMWGANSGSLGSAGFNPFAGGTGYGGGGLDMSSFMSPANDYSKFQQGATYPWTANIPANRYDPNTMNAVYRLAGQQNLDPAAIGGVIKSESNWNPFDITGSYRGLTQIGQDTFNDPGMGGRLNGLTWPQYQAASGADQIDAYGAWLNHYGMQDKLAGIQNVDAPMQAAMLQGMQFAPNRTEPWMNPLMGGNMNIGTSPPTARYPQGAPQAEQLGGFIVPGGRNPTINSMYDFFSSQPGWGGNFGGSY